MKKVLFVVLAAFIGLTSFAGGSIVKPLVTPEFKVAPAVKETKVISVPKGAKVKPVLNEKGEWICVLIIWEDGSWLEICCTNCIIIIVFEAVE